MFIEISELPETLNIDPNSVFPLVFQNATKKITFQSLLQAMNYFNAVSYNKTTGQFTFSIINGTSALLNTDLQQSFKNVSLSDGVITFISHDGETKTIDCQGQRFITSEEIAKVAQIDNKYEKPSGGIPKTDLASDVQTSLGKADSALQTHQDISGKENTSNKTSTIDSNSTNTQYAGAKAVYDYVQGIVGDISDLLDELNGEIVLSGGGNNE